MSRTDPQIIVKLQIALQKLSASIDPDSKNGSSIMIEDDTTLQKLYSYVDTLMKTSDNEFAWAQNTGLVDFIQRSLEPSIVSISGNSSLVAFAIKILGSLLSTEETFGYYVDGKVMMDFFVIWPNLRNDPTLASATLILIEALLRHDSGVSWITKNGVWEKLLLPSLRSPSIFVQRKGVKVITSLLILVLDTEYFKIFVQDLMLLSEKFCELRPHVNRTLSEEIRQSCLCVLFVFKEMYIKTLGKTAMYSKVKDIGDVTGRLMLMVDRQVALHTVTHVTDVVILNSLHSFQEKVMEYGITEQFLVDALCVDMITLARTLYQKGYIESFFRSSVNMHKYWMMLVTNLEENRQISLKTEESVLHIMTGVQVTPMLVLYEDFVKQSEVKAIAFSKWNEEIHSKINIKESLKVEAAKLENEIISSFRKDTNTTLRMAVVCISSLSSAADQLHPICAVTIFQGLVFLLCLTSRESTSIVKFHGELQRTAVDALRILVEKFEIDWRKCVMSICLLAVLCDVMNNRNLSTQVKVATLKSVNSCIVGFIPPVMSMLVNSEEQKCNSIEAMGEILAGYLSDLEWEVRDSALEVLITCMTLAKDKYPYFVEWMQRYSLNTAVVAALEDVEGYVRASALSVLACVVSIDKVWRELEDENLQHRALAAVLWEGDTPVRKAAINLVKALFSAGKYREEDVNSLVINIIQKSTEDSDDEIRLSALEFIHVHIQENLLKLGMVDGEFPSVTFSRGKITKLDKNEVQNRVIDVISWICNSGYLSCLLMCLNDPVTSVGQKAQEILCFLHNLIIKYDITRKVDSVRRHASENKDVHLKMNKDEDSMECASSENIVKVAGQNVKIPEDFHALDQIDRTINDILSSSTLDNVSNIKRPPDGMTENSRTDRKTVVLSKNNVPSCNPAVPIEYMLHNIDKLCRHNIKEDDDLTVVDLLSLLDDILLDGCKVEGSDADDQHLRDCY